MTAKLSVKRGAYATDGRELVQIVSVSQAGIKLQNVVTLEKRLVSLADLAGWRDVKPRHG